MALTTCPECSGQLSDNAYACPHCGAPTGKSMPTGYEYKSKSTFMGLPLVHIATGRNTATGRPRFARGIIAIGDVAFGFIALGGLSFGGITLGGVSIGLASLGGLAIGLGVAIGGLAIGSIAIGGMAIGIYAIGGGALGLHRLSGSGIDPAMIEALRNLGLKIPNR